MGCEGTLRPFKARVEELKSDLKSIDRRIKRLEKKYGITSQEFLAGKAPPRLTEEDREEWKSLLYYRDNLKKVVEMLRKEVEKDQRIIDSLPK